MRSDNYQLFSAADSDTSAAETPKCSGTTGKKK